METNPALQELNEAADLVAMVEELLNGQPPSPATLKGLRITLKSIKRTIVSSRNAVINELSRSVSTVDTVSAKEQLPAAAEAPAQLIEPKIDLTEPDRMILKRKDLRASIERIVERS